MPQLIMIAVYPVREACQELARRTGWPKDYSRQEVLRLIHKYGASLEPIGKRYFLTEADIERLANLVRKEKWPRNT